MPVEAVVLPIVFLSFFSVLAFWIHTRQRRQRELLAAQQDLQTRILERFDSPQEFSQFLQTDGGRRFLSGLTDERGWRPARRIMTAVQVGIVVTSLGLALFALAAFTNERDFTYPATIIFFLGAGFLASALASYRMSKRWGLLPEENGRGLEELTGTP
jgi:hypothetical protein